MENKITVEATAEQWSVLLQLLNVGTKAGAFDLSMVEAVAFWAKHVESSAKKESETTENA